MDQKDMSHCWWSILQQRNEMRESTRNPTSLKSEKLYKFSQWIKKKKSILRSIREKGGPEKGTWLIKEREGRQQNLTREEMRERKGKYVDFEDSFDWAKLGTQRSKDIK